MSIVEVGKEKRPDLLLGSTAPRYLPPVREMGPARVGMTELGMESCSGGGEDPGGEKVISY
jgi:hypothetical protein